jgi:hypothetical protein
MIRAGAKIDLITMNSENRQLFIYAKQTLYMVQPGDGRGLQMLDINGSIDAIWYCGRAKGLLLVCEIDGQRSREQRLYTGEKRIRLLTEDSSKDDFMNTPAGRAGFCSVLDLTTTRCRRNIPKIIVLHSERPGNGKVAVFHGIDKKTEKRSPQVDRKEGHRLCELALPYPDFRPVSLTADGHDNLWVLGVGADGAIKLMRIHWFKLLLHSQDWWGFIFSSVARIVHRFGS